MLEKAKKVISDYKNQSHERGERDCNLMVLQIFDEENHDKMKGRYKTLVGGARISQKVYGVKSMYEYLLKSDFQQVQKGFERPLDVIAFKESHNVYLCVGTQWFGVNDDDVFGLVSPILYQEDDYVIFRKGTK